MTANEHFWSQTYSGPALNVSMTNKAPPTHAHQSDCYRVVSHTEIEGLGSLTQRKVLIGRGESPKHEGKALDIRLKRKLS